MKKASAFLASSLAMGAILASSSASAQADDLDPAAVEAAARYALPTIFDAYLVGCSAELEPTGYALSNADRLTTKFSEGTDEAWPAAKEAMLAIIAEGDGEQAAEMNGLFEMMGDEALRPFVDALVGSLVAQEIKTEDCGVVERGLEILDPLPADNVAQLAGFLVEMGQRGEANEDDGEWTDSE